MKFIKKFKKYIKYKLSINKQQEKETQYTKMTTEELNNLSDRELFDAVSIRIEIKVNLNGVSSLNENERIFYVINYFDCEVNNGGLCQFFINSSRIFAPSINYYLEFINAKRHKRLYDNFIKKNKIDVNNLSSFNSDTDEEFIEQYERYPFDKFDKSFYQMEPLEKYLTAFVRENINSF